jgi:hypothetical protein
MRDTSPEADAIQIAVLRRMSGARRLLLACQLSDSTRSLALARLRARHPGLSQRELVKRLLRELFPLRALPPEFR